MSIDGTALGFLYDEGNFFIFPILSAPMRVGVTQ